MNTINLNNKVSLETQNDNGEILNKFDRNIERLKIFTELDKDEKSEIVEWLIDDCVDKKEIKKSALGYFWFVDENDIQRFNSTMNDNIFNDTTDYLNYSVDWEKWNKEFDFWKLIDNIKSYVEFSMVENLKEEIKEAINDIDKWKIMN